MDEAPRLPLWIKLAHTAFVAVLVPVYASRYGFGNFLWFSDVALLGSVAALWLEDALLASTLAVAILGPELAWNVDFFGRLLSGRHLIGLSRYMFDRGIALLVCSDRMSPWHSTLPLGGQSAGERARKPSAMARPILATRSGFALTA